MKIQRYVFWGVFILSSFLRGSYQDPNNMTPLKGSGQRSLADRRGSVVAELPATPLAQKIKKFGAEEGMVNSTPTKSPSPFYLDPNNWEIVSLLENKQEGSIIRLTPSASGQSPSFSVLDSSLSTHGGSLDLALTPCRLTPPPAYVPFKRDGDEILLRKKEQLSDSFTSVQGRSPVVQTTSFSDIPDFLQHQECAAASDGRESSTPIDQTDKGQLELLLQDCEKHGVVINPSERNIETILRIKEVLEQIRNNQDLKKTLDESSNAYRNLVILLKKLQESEGKTREKMTKFAAEMSLLYHSPTYPEMREFQYKRETSPIPSVIVLGCAHNSEMIANNPKLPFTDWRHVIKSHVLPETYTNLHPVWIKNKEVLGIMWNQSTERKTVLPAKILSELLHKTANSLPLFVYKQEQQGGSSVDIEFYYDAMLKILTKRVSCCSGSTRITEFPLFSINEEDIQTAEKGPIAVAERMFNDSVLDTISLSKGDIRELVKKSSKVFLGSTYTVVDIGHTQSLQRLTSLSLEKNTKSFASQEALEFYVVMSNEFYQSFIHQQQTPVRPVTPVGATPVKKIKPHKR